MWIREEFGRWFTGKRKSGEGKFPCAASRLRSGSLRSPPLRHEAAHPPQGVTHAVITKCYLCDAQIPVPALPFPAHSFLLNFGRCLNWSKWSNHNFVQFGFESWPSLSRMGHSYRLTPFRSPRRPHSEMEPLRFEALETKTDRRGRAARIESWRKALPDRSDVCMNL